MKKELTYSMLSQSLDIMQTHKMLKELVAVNDYAFSDESVKPKAENIIRLESVTCEMIKQLIPEMSLLDKSRVNLVINNYLSFPPEPEIDGMIKILIIK